MPLTPGKPLGIRKQGGFETCRRQMQKGEGILVFTDGVTEAESKTKGFYGEARLLSLLHGLPARADADVCVGKVLEGIKEFCAGDPQYDDIAIVCVRYNGNSE